MAAFAADDEIGHASDERHTRVVDESARGSDQAIRVVGRLEARLDDVSGGAVDKRVVGRVPIVYNFLDLPAQARHIQGRLGRQTVDRCGLIPKRIVVADEHAAGKQLIGSVDPAAYLDRLTMPKLLVLASNDAYWPLSAADVYFNKLPGDNRVFNVPQRAAHAGNRFAAVAGSAAAWGRLILG
jgi:PhoPQ-activated pathogenicity-related protein